MDRSQIERKRLFGCRKQRAFSASSSASCASSSSEYSSDTEASSELA